MRSAKRLKKSNSIYWFDWIQWQVPKFCLCVSLIVLQVTNRTSQFAVWLGVLSNSNPATMCSIVRELSKLKTGWKGWTLLPNSFSSKLQTLRRKSIYFSVFVPLEALPVSLRKLSGFGRFRNDLQFELKIDFKIDCILTRIHLGK